MTFTPFRFSTGHAAHNAFSSVAGMGIVDSPPLGDGTSGTRPGLHHGATHCRVAEIAWTKWAYAPRSRDSSPVHMPTALVSSSAFWVW